jgi:regulator of nonsense transcripts 2
MVGICGSKQAVSILYLEKKLLLENGRPAWGRICWLDLPNDFFRVRLCCVLLDTCGIYFNKGPSKTRLDAFLTFFQVSYIAGYTDYYINN